MVVFLYNNHSLKLSMTFIVDDTKNSRDVYNKILILNQKYKYIFYIILNYRFVLNIILLITNSSNNMSIILTFYW